MALDKLRVQVGPKNKIKLRVQGVAPKENVAKCIQIPHQTHGKDNVNAIPGITKASFAREEEVLKGGPTHMYTAML